MPPRRPGGKYKGLVTRNKGDHELAQEALARAKKSQEAALAKAMKRKGQEVQLDGESTKEQEEQQRKQQILNMLMGGKKGSVKKFFKAWEVGTAMSKKERRVLDRKGAWMASCEYCATAADPYCKVCHAHERLTPSTFELPFDSMIKTMLSGAFQAGKAAAAAAAQRRKNLSMSRRKSSMTDSPFKRRQSAMKLKEEAEEQATPTATKVTFGSDEADAEAGPAEMPATEPEPWLGGEGLEQVQHYKNGRKLLLDPETMRISVDRGTVLVDPGANLPGQMETPSKAIARNDFLE